MSGGGTRFWLSEGVAGGTSGGWWGVESGVFGLDLRRGRGRECWRGVETRGDEEETLRGTDGTDWRGGEGCWGGGGWARLTPPTERVKSEGCEFSMEMERGFKEGRRTVDRLGVGGEGG